MNRDKPLFWPFSLLFSKSYLFLSCCSCDRSGLFFLDWFNKPDQREQLQKVFVSLYNEYDWFSAYPGFSHRLHGESTVGCSEIAAQTIARPPIKLCVDRGRLGLWNLLDLCICKTDRGEQISNWKDGLAMSGCCLPGLNDVHYWIVLDSLFVLIKIRQKLIMDDGWYDDWNIFIYYRVKP